MANIGHIRCVCGQHRVPFYFSVSHAPRTPSDGPTPASTRRRPHFRRVDPFLATQPAKVTRLVYPPTRKWPDCSTTPAQRPTMHHLSSTGLHPYVTDEDTQEHLPDVHDFALPSSLSLSSSSKLSLVIRPQPPAGSSSLEHFFLERREA